MAAPMAGAGTMAVGTNALGLDAELFTRGKGGENRGESLVQKHLDKLQQEKENLAMEKLGALMPQMGPAVRVLALKEAVFDVETAVSALRSFQAQNDEALKALHKKRRKLKDSEAEAVKEAEERVAAISSSSSSSSESDSSGSESDSSGSDDGKGRKHKKRSSKKKRKRSSKDSKRSGKKKKRRAADGSDEDSDSDGGRRRSSKKKKKSKDKADKATAKAGADNFGRFGIIRETDMTAKRGEFLLWAVEVKKVNPDLLGRPEERELFRDFMEDYNTGTMPHRKYYNLEIYQREKMAKEAAKHGKKEGKTKPSALEDEEAVRRQREEERQKLAEERRKQALAELQAGDAAKLRDMREQEMLRMQMQNAYRAGDKRTADLLFKKLMPDEERIRRGLPPLK